MIVKNLADMKRAIALPGVVIRVVQHWQPQLVGTTRTPTKIQTNGYWFDAPRFSDGVISRMWAEHPKAAQLEFNEDGTVTFYPRTPRSWTLQFCEPDEAAADSVVRNPRRLTDALANTAELNKK